MTNSRHKLGKHRYPPLSLQLLIEFPDELLSLAVHLTARPITLLRQGKVRNPNGQRRTDRGNIPVMTGRKLGQIIRTTLRRELNPRQHDGRRCSVIIGLVRGTRGDAREEVAMPAL
ncbi:uncharacterized protein A4U43_C09F15350 [Asparagus officinalis]|uniref:Uncharacterized protein n=1 Tax=Asparagus officinalis TaxID=4686 RepID=A0A5P1E863_ASPOF|nr:uncharacterized protein A4U43_C09F15350 [Asparagus officinalis]